ncbi:MAG TPA: hypothetical protein VL179_15030 [Mycobacterium sp.]|nr:hypothetical protein [Mycobacterium sp.]
MSSEAPGHRLKVVAAGLYQLAAHCEAVGDELSTAAAAPPVATSTWQTNAPAVSTAQVGACADLASATGRLSTRAQAYTKAATAYTVTDDHGAVQFTALVPR